MTAGLVYAVCLFMTGILTIGGTGAACNLPIILSCLSENKRTTGVAVERFFGSGMFVRERVCVVVWARGASGGLVGRRRVGCAKTRWWVGG